MVTIPNCPRLQVADVSDTVALLAIALPVCEYQIVGEIS